MVCTACLVCFISTVNGCSNKKKEEAYPWKASASSGNITNLKQSNLETFDIYATIIKLTLVVPIFKFLMEICDIATTQK